MLYIKTNAHFTNNSKKLPIHCKFLTEIHTVRIFHSIKMFALKYSTYLCSYTYA